MVSCTGEQHLSGGKCNTGEIIFVLVSRLSKYFIEDLLTSEHQ